MQKVFKTVYISFSSTMINLDQTNIFKAQFLRSMSFTKTLLYIDFIKIH